MNETLQARFNDTGSANTARRALLAAGCPPQEAVVLPANTAGAAIHTPTAEQLNYSVPQTLSGNDYNTTYDPLENSLRQAGSHIEGGNLSTSDLNPAQNDYPLGPEAGQVAVSSVPGNAPRDYNAGIEKDDYNQNYGKSESRTVDAEDAEETRRDNNRLINGTNQADSFALLSIRGGWLRQHSQEAEQMITTNGGALI